VYDTTSLHAIQYALTNPWPAVATGKMPAAVVAVTTRMHAHAYVSLNSPDTAMIAAAGPAPGPPGAPVSSAVQHSMLVMMPSLNDWLCDVVDLLKHLVCYLWHHLHGRHVLLDL
jgi:hypothetical protein